jgi:hypothetical protein
MRELRPSLVALISLALCAWTLGPSHAAPVVQSVCPTDGCRAYLPLITYQPQLILFSPADHANIGSLAPILVWKPPITGTYHIQVTEDSAFLPTSTFSLSETKGVKSPLPDQIDTLITSNLNPQHTYYWRVYVIPKDGLIDTAGSSFITPAKDSHLLPPGVQLLAPANHTTVASTSVVLQWRSVPSALFYRFRVYDSNNVLLSGIPGEVSGAINSYQISGLTPGMTYHWKVKALNAYGWGPYLPDFVFTAS